MRHITSVLAVAIVASIIASGLIILCDSDDVSQIRSDLYEKYHLDDYYRELTENGISTWDPGRLWPGSLGSVQAPCASPSYDMCQMPRSGIEG